MERVTEIKEGGKRETEGFSRSSRVMSWSAWRWMTMLGRVFATRLALPVSWAATAKPAPLSRDEYNKMTRQDRKGRFAPSAPRLILRSVLRFASPMARLPTFDGKGLRGYRRGWRSSKLRSSSLAADAGRARL